ncbi:unnamed protein product [Amoebophrya sp. A120]|nr:unnamed protein product [Amoebophrya sp. A120]|eukprot:GSA120T00005247001.1
MWLLSSSKKPYTSSVSPDGTTGGTGSERSNKGQTTELRHRVTSGQGGSLRPTGGTSLMENCAIPPSSAPIKAATNQAKMSNIFSQPIKSGAETAIQLLQKLHNRRPGDRNHGELVWEEWTGCGVCCSPKMVFARWKKLAFLRFKLYSFSFNLVGILAAAYMQIGNIAAQSYIEYARETPYRWSHLPDVFLDFIDKPSVDNWKTYCGDAMPYLTVLFGLAYLFLADLACDLVVAANVFAASWVFNGIAENVTILPSSFGYERCLDRNGINHGDDHKYQWSNTTGSCAAMMWSGHTFVTYLACWGLLQGFRTHFPAYWTGRPFDSSSSASTTTTDDGSAGQANQDPKSPASTVQPKLYASGSKKELLRNIFVPTRSQIFLYTMVVLEMFLLIIDHSHYTVDVYIALILAQLTLSSDRLKFYLYYLNPYTAGGVVAYENNVFYQKLLARKILFLSQHAGGLESCHVSVKREETAKAKEGSGQEVGATAARTEPETVEVGEVEMTELKIVFDPWSPADREMADFWNM